MLFMSLSICLVLLIFSILYMIWGTKNKIEVANISLLYCLLSSIFDFFLFKSKDILYDDTKIYIRKKDNFAEIPFHQIVEIKRVFFYFYQITYFKDLNNVRNKVYYYISPYPSIFRQNELKMILKDAKNIK